MKICHVTNVHPPFDGRIFHKMASSAALNGYDVTLVAPHDKEEIRNGVKIKPINKPKSRLNRMLSTIKLRKLLLSIDADIYHFHDPELIPIMLSVHSFRRKVIYDIHEFNREAIRNKKWLPKILRLVLSKLTWEIEKLACRRFDCTISATEELSKVYEPYSNNNKYIWNYDFNKDIDINSKQENKDIDIIHVGLLVQERLDFLLDVIDELNSRGLYYNWCFVGVPTDLYEKRYHSYDKKKREHIKIIGRIPFEDVRQYYLRSKIGINYHVLDSQLMVAMPLKIFEYMKQGLTVVTSNLPPINRFVKNNINGIIIKDNNIEEFADSIYRLIEKGDFEKISKVNKLEILHNYNWESEAEKLMSIYEEVYKGTRKERHR